jgi:hypothetical protein
MADCEIQDQGNVFGWNLANSWEISNETIITSVELKNLCQRDALMVSVAQSCQVTHLSDP